MALTVKQLNSDTSFLLSFEPIIPEAAVPSVTPRPFTILLDPWLTGPSTNYHPKLSTTTQKHQACITSLSELTDPPNIVIVSQPKSDHCHEATLRQLPPSGTDTLIVATSAAARLIRSWDYFDPSMVISIQRWEDPRPTGKKSIIRVSIPSLYHGGREGEVTIAFIPQKWDVTGLHGALGITYRPPGVSGLMNEGGEGRLPTPPMTPDSRLHSFSNYENNASARRISRDTHRHPLSPPISPTPLQSRRSGSTLFTSRPGTSSQNEPTGTYSTVRPLSVIYSPHGVRYRDLSPFVTSHLVVEAALPLTALLHCMNRIDNPWWLGGNVSAGVPHGAETAAKLGAKVWVSAHDGEKQIEGSLTCKLKTHRWTLEEILDTIELKGVRVEQGPPGRKFGRTRRNSQKAGGTEIMRLGSGEEVLVSATGVAWRTAYNTYDQPAAHTTFPETHTITRQPTLTRKKSATSVRTHQGQPDKTSSDFLRLPRVHSGMIPKKLSVYKALKTIDIIKPSPTLVLEQDVSTLPTERPQEEQFKAFQYPKEEFQAFEYPPEISPRPKTEHFEEFEYPPPELPPRHQAERFQTPRYSSKIPHRQRVESFQGVDHRTAVMHHKTEQFQAYQYQPEVTRQKKAHLREVLRQKKEQFQAFDYSPETPRQKTTDMSGVDRAIFQQTYNRASTPIPFKKEKVD
ncbi:hypothetical protein F5Y16DRAFT_363770 [Xylariaceae sp. FL0255]|nr:hypothetical protein F5Y16DRAFT_363770 [Xylariaceae sp. FL0255]